MPGDGHRLRTCGGTQVPLLGEEELPPDSYGEASVRMLTWLGGCRCVKVTMPLMRGWLGGDHDDRDQSRPVRVS